MARPPDGDGVSCAGRINAQMVITADSTASSMQSVVQPKWKTHSPIAGASDTAAVLASPHQASPCARRDSGMNSLMMADAEARMPDHIEPWIAPTSSSRRRSRITP